MKLLPAVQPLPQAERTRLAVFPPEPTPPTGISVLPALCRRSKVPERFYFNIITILPRLQDVVK